MSDSIVLKVAMARSQSEAGYGRARMDSESRRALGLELGDTVEIVGKRTVVAKVFKGDPEDEGRGLLLIDGLTRTNAGVSVDESVTVRRCDPRPAEQVVLTPNIPEGKRIRFEKGIEDVFLRGLLNRPLVADTDIIVPNIALMGNRSTFSVASTVPKGPVIVHGGTKVIVKDAPRKQEAKGQRGHQITYDDVGGLDDELRRIREMIELPLKHPELFERLGIGAPRGVLLYGPPGTGKTLMAEAVANESGASLFSVRGPEIMGQYYGQSEERLREIFKQAGESAPSIIFLDEIDSIAPSRDSVSGEVERRVVAQLLTLMDGLGDRGNVIVIGATNREDSIDPALRRPGRFDREIEIGIPGRRARADILSVHLREMPLTEDVTPEALASMTQGFVGADLAALCREAAMHCLSSRLGEFDLDRQVPTDILESMRVSMADFESALSEVEPSGMREVLVEIPKVTWEDVGGLDDVRRQIREVLSTEDGNPCERLGIEPGKGILLYGPPGTGKTLIAKALANESGTNFISVNGPEMASKWMGESERAIRQIFKRAKQMAPCIIFFDELDSIAPVRGMGDGSAWERVVAQLLTSMDGVEGMRNVTVMGATNRPDMIDPALLRPGRFDRLVLVGKPDETARLRILEVHTRRMPLDGVDLASVAAATDGYTGADLASLCREAGLSAYREDPGATEVCQRHFDAALGLVGPSVTQDVMDGYEDAGRRLRRRRGGWDSVPFYGRSVPSAAAGVALAVMVAGRPGGTFQPPLQEGLHRSIGVARAPGDRPDARGLQALHRAPSQAAAYQRRDAQRPEHADELAVPLPARALHLRGDDLPVLHVVDLELLRPAEVLEHLSVLISGCNPHDFRTSISRATAASRAAGAAGGDHGTADPGLPGPASAAPSPLASLEERVAGQTLGLGHVEQDLRQRPDPVAVHLVMCEVSAADRRHEAGVPQHPHVLRDGCLGDPEPAGEGAGADIVPQEYRQYREPRPVRYRPEVVRGIAHVVIPLSDCLTGSMYMRVAPRADVRWTLICRAPWPRDRDGVRLDGEVQARKPRRGGGPADGRGEAQTPDGPAQRAAPPPGRTAGLRQDDLRPHHRSGDTRRSDGGELPGDRRLGPHQEARGHCHRDGRRRGDHDPHRYQDDGQPPLED